MIFYSLFLLFLLNIFDLQRLFICVQSLSVKFFWREWSFSSVQFSHSVVSDSLWPHELQHARPPCPSPSPGVHSDSCPSSPWCHPAISSSVVPFSSCPQSLPASESFPMSQLFAWGGQSTGVSALASFLPKKSQGWSPSEWTGWISLQSKGTLKSLLQHPSSKASILWPKGRRQFLLKFVLSCHENRNFISHYETSLLLNKPRAKYRVRLRTCLSVQPLSLSSPT